MRPSFLCCSGGLLVCPNHLQPMGCKWLGQTNSPPEQHKKDGRNVQAPVRELDAVHGKRTGA